MPGPVALSRNMPVPEKKPLAPPHLVSSVTSGVAAT